LGAIFNEMTGAEGQVREPYRRVEGWLKTLGRGNLRKAMSEAEGIFCRQGAPTPRRQYRRLRYLGELARREA
jgi:uncharacterized circularly permuted ATP-grasp superfamily protein